MSGAAPAGLTIRWPVAITDGKKPHIPVADAARMTLPQGITNPRYDGWIVNVHSIKFRLVALGVGLIALTYLLRVVFVLPLAHDQLGEVAAAQQLTLASYVARDIDQSVLLRQELVAELARDFPPALVAQPVARASWLDQQRRRMPVFERGLMLLDAEGRLLQASGALSADAPQDFSGSDWLRAALAASADAPVLGKSARLWRSGDPVLFIAAPVRIDGRVVAVLAGVTALDASGFLEGLRHTGLGEGGGFLLIAPSERRYIAASDAALSMRPLPAPGANRLYDRALEGFRGTGLNTGADGGEELVAIASVPSTGWFLVARLPAAEAFRPVDRLRRIVMQSSALALVVVSLTMLLFLGWILRPLTDTARAMRDMADGRRPLEALPVARNDEIGALVRGFNYLLERLRGKEAALRASEARMSFIAHHDALTGLYNRTMLEDRLQQALARVGRDGSCCALLFCDLDAFKPINDGHGHEVGDAVLVQVAARLAARRRALDTVARLGGDEFVVLLADLEQPRADAERLALEYLAAIGQPYRVDDRDFTLGVSIGIALYRQGECVSASQLMSRADIAMYQAKRAGKGRICFFGEVPAEMA